MDTITTYGFKQISMNGKISTETYKEQFIKEEIRIFYILNMW